MTIPEEMMAVIQETAKKAAREGAKEVIAEQPTSEHEAVAEKLSDVQEALHGCGLYGRNRRP